MIFVVGRMPVPGPRTSRPLELKHGSNSRRGSKAGGPVPSYGREEKTRDMVPSYEGEGTRDVVARYGG